MDEQVAAALDDAFPDRPVDEVAPPGPSWNEKNRTVRVEFVDGETAYLKVASDGDGSRIARERAVIAHVDANSDVRVPEILVSAPNAAVPHLVTAPLAGRCLVGDWGDASVNERATFARAVGEALADLHAIPVEEHGQVVGGDEDSLDVDAAPWTDVLVDRIEFMHDLSPSERFEGHFDEVIVTVEANRDLLDDAPAALVHGDPAKPNCFYDEAGVGFVDWEIAHVGDPARELVRTRGQQIGSPRRAGPEAVVTALHEGYRDRAGSLPDGFDERRPVYEAIRLLGVSGFFENWADLADEPTEELAEWLQAEMDRRLAAIEQ